MIRGLMRGVLGFHDLHGEIDFEALKRSAIKLNCAAELNTIRVGIFLLQDDGCSRYYCRTRVGWFFRSFFHLRFNGKLELIPHPLRIAIGAFFLCFWVLMNAVGAGVLISKWGESSIYTHAAALAFLLLLDAVVALSGLLVLVAEKKLVLWGYKKYSAS